MDTNNQFGSQGLIEANELSKKDISNEKNINTKKNRRKRSKGSERQRLRWTDQQTEDYCYFIQENEAVLLQEFKRHKQRIYNQMAQFLKSRTKLKCKSHHHKLIKKYKSIPEIVKNLRPDLLGKKKGMQQNVQMGNRRQNYYDNLSKRNNQTETPSESNENRHSPTKCLRELNGTVTFRGSFEIDQNEYEQKQDCSLDSYQLGESSDAEFDYEESPV